MQPKTVNRGKEYSSANMRFQSEVLDRTIPVLGTGSYTTGGFFPLATRRIGLGIKPPRLHSFYWTLSGNQFVLFPGDIVTNKAVYSIAKTTLTLAGATEYVYIYHAVDNSTTGVANAETDPQGGDGTQYRWRIAKLTAVASGHYNIAHIYRSYGDIDLFLALQ